MTAGPIGEAHVLISPDIRGFAARLKTELRAAMAAAGDPKVGVGADTRGFGEQVKRKVKETERTTKSKVPVAPDLSRFGPEVRAYIQQFDPKEQVKIAASLDRASTAKVVAEAKRIANAAERGAEVDIPVNIDRNSVQRATRDFDLLGGKGRSALRSLNREVFNSNIRLREMANILGGATLPVLVSLASVGIAAFGSLTSAIVSAAAAAATLPNFLAAAVQALGVGALAFGGLGNAVKALSQAHDAVGTSALSAARKDNTAAEQIKAAQRGVRDALRGVRDAQLDLNAARVEARQRLADLRLEEVRLSLDLRGATLGIKEAEADLAKVTHDSGASILEQRKAQLAVEAALANQAKVNRNLRSSDLQKQQAQLRVDEARAKLGEVNAEQGPTSLERQRAALRVQEARQARTEVQRRIALNRQEIRSGVEGSDQVVAAKERQRDAARSLSDAQEGLAKASRSAALSTAAAAAPVAKLTTAMDHLSPAAQRFARFLFSLKPRIDELRAAAAAGLFPGLEDAIRRLMTGLFPTFRTIVDQTARAMGGLAREGAAMLASGPFRRDFAQLGRDNVQIIRDAGHSSLNLVDALRNLIAAARPLTLSISAMVLGWTENVRASAAAGRESGKLTRFFQAAGASLRSLARIAGNVGATIAAVLIAAFPSGAGLLTSLEDATDRMRELATSSEGLRNMRQFFDRARPAIETISGLVVTLARKLFEVVVHVKNVTEAVAGFLEKNPQLKELVGSALALAFAFKLLNVAGLAGVVGSLGQLVLFSGPVGLIAGAVLALGAAFAIAYASSTPFREGVNSLARTIKDAVMPALRAFGGFITGQVIPALQRAIPFVRDQLVGGLDFLAQALKDNRPQLALVGKLLLELGKFIAVTVIPAIFKLTSVHLRALFVSFGIIIGVIGVLVRVFKVMVSGILFGFQTILDAAATAFGWVPGIGPKLKAARDKFHEFAKGVNNALDGINDKKVTVSATGVFHLPKGVSVHDLVGKAEGGPISGPGPKGRDSRLIMAAPGEHMLTAAEVDRMGGHGAVYALRAAVRQGWRIPGFAAGGAVGDAGDARGVKVTAFGSISPLEQGAAAFDRTLGRIAQSMAKLLQGVAGVGGRAGQVFAFLRQQLGESYLWGATGPDRWDCSGLMLRAFEKVGIHLPRVAREQQHAGRAVSRAAARFGDLIYFGNPAHHIGFYMGGNTMLHAPHTGDVVKMSRNRIGDGYRRVLDKGGFLMPGINVVENRTGRPELVPGPGRDHVGRAVSAGFGQGTHIENLIVQPLSGQFRLRDVMTELRLQGVH